MKQHEDIIKEIREWANANFIYAFKDPRVAILAKLDQLEQEQKEVEVIKGEWFQQTNWESKPIDFITLKSTIRTDDIDHIEIVKKRGV